MPLPLQSSSAGMTTLEAEVLCEDRLPFKGDFLELGQRNGEGP